jgi:hypothetical protein
MTWLKLGQIVGGFLLRHWVWIALAGALFAANHYRDQSAQRAAETKAVETKLEATEASLTDWKNAYNVQVSLALETAKARAAETQTIVTIRDAAGTAKQEAENAPGADDPYRYSDGAYRFMREPTGARPSDAAPSATGLDAR